MLCRTDLSLSAGALLSALDSTCLLCQGTGILSPSQREHWDVFSKHHRVARCGDGCGENILYCDYQSKAQ